jgi:hypothetical protein
MITYLLSPALCINAIREALQAGAIGISDCAAMSRVDEKTQHELLAAKLGGASRDQVHRQARKARNGDTPAVRVSRIKCALPGGRMVAISGEGITLDEAIESAQNWIKFAKKAVERGWDAKTLERACAAEAKTGGGVCGEIETRAGLNMDEQQQSVLSFQSILAVREVLELLKPKLSSVERIILAEQLHTIIFHKMMRATLEVTHDNVVTVLPREKPWKSTWKGG